MLIPKDKMPQRNFTADELEAQGYSRADVLSTMKYLEGKGEGTFVIGRRGGKTRFEWGAGINPAGVTESNLNHPPTTNTSQDDDEYAVSMSLTTQDRSKDILRAFANLTGFKGEPTFEALQAHLLNKMKELDQLQKNVVVTEPPGIEHVPIEWITEKNLDNGLVQIGWTFWTETQRTAIAKELRAYRQGK